MELGETELAEDAWRNIYDGSIKAVNTLRDPSLKYEKLKIALNAAVYARMPIEVTSKLRRDITELTRKPAETTKPGKKGLARILEKISSIIFLLAGLFFMAVPEFTATGNIIGNSAGANISFFLSLGLMVIGGVLLFRSFKK